MMTRLRWTVLIAVLVTGCTFATSEADKKKESTQDSDLAAVEKKVKEAVPKVLDILRDEQMPPNTKSKEILDILSPFIRFKLMAKLTLGPQHWGQLSEEQQEEFIDLFTDHLRLSYITKAEHFADEEIHYGDPKWLGKGKRKILMNTYVLINNDKNELHYKFYKNKDGWKVYDIEIEGVSIIRSYRSQYQQSLKEGSVEELFADIRSIVDQHKDELEDETSDEEDATEEKDSE